MAFRLETHSGSSPSACKICQGAHPPSPADWRMESDKGIEHCRCPCRLFREIDILSASSGVVSTNVETRADGMPRSDRRVPDDPGVAVYFKLHGKDRVLACDKWDRVADNIAAIAAHIDAIRRQDRYGVGTLDQAFAGYSALPPPGSSSSIRPWHEVLGLRAHASLAEAETEYRRRAKVAHPDNGGSAERMAELNAAIAEARQSQAA